MQNRLFARSGNGSVANGIVGLTEPIRRVINARFALLRRDSGLMSLVILNGGTE